LTELDKVTLKLAECEYLFQYYKMISCIDYIKDI